MSKHILTFIRLLEAKDQSSCIHPPPQKDSEQDLNFNSDLWNSMWRNLMKKDSALLKI